MSRNTLICIRCRAARNRNGFRRVDGRIDRTCKVCRGEMQTGEGALVRCQLHVPAVPLVDGRPVQGFKATVPCGALVFRGREAQHLAEVHGAPAAAPELVDRAFARVKAGGEEWRDAG
jgi:hypothetical protein